ncbi:sulfate adenylyltransferase subunit 1 [Conexibacter sp. DBS9H8]|uniref:sulfate adenylyltransferase subunit 1 n=1 Tax=Conexibacter sp. DBS9H8 TaxID=2937801 RepID=UPI00200F2A9C|nr:GTP-binding protein [Conexibacter sp. DBS9H8]
MRTLTGRSELLRIATAGSVDDGKSTLIGRLLHDTKSILEDQLEHVTLTSARRGDGYLNLALLTDGLRAEREQGITIDVAYRYFQTGAAAGITRADPDGRGRKFIIADTPGHEQYTRNMVTGASTADLSIVLVDARRGVSVQTRRHAYISSLLRIPHLVVAVNKMDLVDYSEAAFTAIVDELTDWAARVGTADLTFIPISALSGDNVVERSAAMPWYDGPPLLSHLEHVVIAADRNLEELRFPVQWVVRPNHDAFHDYRGYAGQVAGGVLEPGQEVIVLPSGRRTRVRAIDTFDGPLQVAFPTQSVTVRLEDELDISRGDMLADPDDRPAVVRELEATVCWMAEEPLRAGGRYLIKHTTRTARAVIDALEYRVDVNTLAHDHGAGELALNEIGRVRLRTSAPLMIDAYATNRSTGSFILIDEASNDTVGAGMIRSGR